MHRFELVEGRYPIIIEQEKDSLFFLFHEMLNDELIWSLQVSKEYQRVIDANLPILFKLI